MAVFLQGAVHIFSTRTDLCAKSLYNEAERIENTREERALPYMRDIIIYPYAVSSFEKFQLAYDYIAETYSRRRKADVLLSVVGIRDGLVPKDEEIIVLLWASNGRSITSGKLRYKGGAIIEKEDPDFFAIPPAMLPSGPNVWSSMWSKMTPLEIAGKMGIELGVFIGGTNYNEFLDTRCVPQKRRPWGIVYKANGDKGRQGDG